MARQRTLLSALRPRAKRDRPTGREEDDDDAATGAGTNASPCATATPRARELDLGVRGGRGARLPN